VLHFVLPDAAALPESACLRMASMLGSGSVFTCTTEVVDSVKGAVRVVGSRFTCVVA